MPTQDYNGPSPLPAAAVEQPVIACPPPPPTPPPEHVELSVPVRPAGPLPSNHQPSDLNSFRAMYVDNNTGAAMAISQEESLYISPDASPCPSLRTAARHVLDDKDKMDITQDETTPSKASGIMENLDSSPSSASMAPLSPRSMSPASPILDGANQECGVKSQPTCSQTNHLDVPSFQSIASKPAVQEGQYSVAALPKQRVKSHNGAKVDQELDWDAGTATWDFTNKPLLPKYPSALFQCDSRYTGTQQSDRQIYNVSVRILTVDMDQCSCTGYLTIKGLTPEHETLQTYFTGEIIGGPGHRYGFKTSQWGASDKTDLTHWARFPAWKSYAAHTKKSLDFPYPPAGDDWWQQENIFMRWKEHFLVPNHKTKSIAGASFEGFYYICLNQIEGKISGIYFHSRSEKYQKLELKHEGNTGIWHRGVTPCIEFR